MGGGWFWCGMQTEELFGDIGIWDEWAFSFDTLSSLSSLLSGFSLQDLFV